MTPAAAPGTRLTPSLELSRRIGAGGMGTVWIAKHLALRKDVVVKLMAESMAGSDELRRRFAQEAAVGANVKSPHVVQVFDTGISEEHGPYIVMELLEGEDLGARLAREARLPTAEVARVVAHVAHALDRAHALGIVHRDVKPANIFLCAEPGAPFLAKVLDFGVARWRDDAAPQTGTGISLGTPTYMSPEQAAGLRELDGKSDLYALGLVAFRALTGEPAFPRASFEALGLGVYNLPVPTLTARLASLPSAVDDWFERACAREPAERFPDGAVMAAELARALGLAGAPPDVTTRDAPRGDLAVELREDRAPAADDDAPRSESPTRAHGPPAEPRGEAPTLETDAGLSQATSPGPAPAASAAPSRGWARPAAATALLGLVVGAWAWRSAGTPGAGASDDGAVSAAPATEAPAAASSIPIGVLLDLSGERRESGAALLAATEAARDLVNRSGGVRGRPLRLVVKDDQGDTGAFLAESARALLGTEGLEVLLGPMTSTQVSVVAPLAQEAGVLQITGSATSPALATLQRPAERSLFRTVPSQALQARALARVMRGAVVAPLGGEVEPRTSCMSVAIVSRDDVEGRPFTELLARSLGELGARVVETRFVEATPRVSYEVELRAVARSAADCLVVVLGPRAAARYLRQSADGAAPGPRPPKVFAVNSVATTDFIAYARRDPRDAASASVADGVRGVRPATRLPWRPEYLEFVHLMSAVDGGADASGEPFAASQFDATIYAALALESAGPDAGAAGLRRGFYAIARGGNVHGPQELSQLLATLRRGERVDYVGASGDVEVDPNGDVEADLVTWTVSDGAIVETGRVRPEDARAP